MTAKARVRFGVIGLDHQHIRDLARLLLQAGAALVAYYPTADEFSPPGGPDPSPGEDRAEADDLRLASASAFAAEFPGARLARSAAEILEDGSLQLVAGAAVPCQRAALGVAVMEHGKDYLSDKPGFTTLEQLAEARRVQAATGRIYSIWYGERLDGPAGTKATELVRGGAIGRVVQTIGLGPHRLHPPMRPGWFFRRSRYGGILCDLASHQADQFLWYTGSTRARVVSSTVANYSHPEHRELEDFGEMLLEGDGGHGYSRVDWYTPTGLGVFGDTRLTILGTEGYIEVRSTVDVSGRPGGSHLFLVDGTGVRYFDCGSGDRPFGRQLLADVLERTETAMPQAHCFLASRLVLEAEAGARRLGHICGER